MNKVNSGVPKHWTAGIIFLLSLSICLARGIFFKQTDIDLVFPIVNSAPHAHERNRLIKFEVVDLFNSSHTFSLTENQVYLHLNSTTGELWFHRSKWNALPRETWKIVSKKITINVISSTEDEASTTITLHFTPYPSFKDFCEKHICFYEGISFNTLEDFNDTFKTRDLGRVVPKFHHHMCKDYKVDYKLIDEDQFILLKNYTFYTNASLNREKMTSLNLNVQCHVKSKKTALSQYFTKVYNITIMDLNDNTIKVQSNHKAINVTLDSPYFQKGTIIEERIIFLDDDSHDVNFELEFHLLDDKAEIFEANCKHLGVSHLGSPSTVVSCNLIFKKTSHFTKSPYCVVVQAREHIKKKIHVENSTVCIFSNVSSILKTRPSKRHDDRGTKKSFIKMPNEASTPSDILIKNNIEYPDEVTILQNATFLARVTKPLSKFTDNKTNFKIINDPLDAFNITKVGGIIYVQNASNLADAYLNDSIELVVGTKSGMTFTIKIIVKEAESDCSNDNDFCSRHEFQEECENACGYGSKNGRCVWRPMRDDGKGDERSSIYNTCIPDIDDESCPDGTCDALENYAIKLYEEEGHPYFICSQDCTKNLHGSTRQTPGIGRIKLGHMCACFDDGSCQCGIGHRSTTTTTTTRAPIIINESHNNTDNDDIDKELFKRHADCGTACIIVMIGCPSLLVFMIFFFFTLRRHQVKKMKKRMMLNGSTVSYRDSNDTEIININIINEMAKENYLQTYQKFDFDSKWEWDRSKLILDATLGEGEFGKVMKAYVSDFDAPNTVKTVAVKTVRTSNSSVELLALLSEFQLLQEVTHANVIKLLGACIRGEPPLLIIEYCCYGSLRSYLRLSRKLEEGGDLEIEGVEPVTAVDVLSFLWQTAKGMAYLAEIKLVHRDLALRNVLLAEGKVCKISDFGLTRDVYEDDAYLKKSKDRVPVKWMSPESLADHVYTTKSDVWSFGVVGWEIITLGSTPYPGIPPQNLYHLLKNGYRMQRPENCSSEIYSLLETCWDENPVMRPSFKVIASQFEKLLGTFANYLDVDVVDGAISNPLYISSTQNDNGDAVIKNNPNTKRINSLWSIPKFKSDTSKVDNKKYLLKYDDQIDLLLSRYDKPKPLNETKSTNQRLRYQNDLHTFIKPNRYVNISQPDLLCLFNNDREKLIESRYDTPTMKRIKSYIEMRNISRVSGRRSSISTTNDSFDDNNNERNDFNEMPCKRTTLNENLNFNDLDKLLRDEKEISFKFSSLNNLNQRMTSETKC